MGKYVAAGSGYYALFDPICGEAAEPWNWRSGGASSPLVGYESEPRKNFEIMT